MCRQIFKFEERPDSISAQSFADPVEIEAVVLTGLEYHLTRVAVDDNMADDA